MNWLTVDVVHRSGLREIPPSLMTVERIYGCCVTDVSDLCHADGLLLVLGQHFLNKQIPWSKFAEYPTFPRTTVREVLKTLANPFM